MKVGDLELSEALALYDSYRAKIVNEDNLVNYRLTWTSAIESILTLAFVTLWTSAVGSHDHSAFWIAIAICFTLSIAGIIVSVATYFSLRSAYREIDNVKDAYSNSYSSLYQSDVAVPKIYADEKQFWKGDPLARILPLVFFGLQTLLAIATIFMMIHALIHGPPSIEAIARLSP